MSLLGNQAPDFSDPLGMLGTCHNRMLGLCELLERLPAWIDEHGVDDEVVSATTRVSRYFKTAARLHHQDEEQDLFPLFETDPILAPLIASLRNEHQQLEALWAKLDIALGELAGRRAAPTNLAEFITPFCAAYRAHIAQEDGELLPRAATLLTTAETAAIGAHMAARRSEADSN